MSKRIWQHPEIPADEKTVAWRSAGQLQDTPAFRSWLDREFPQGAAELANEGDMETSRRSFLKLMGASTALAGFGLASCRRPESYIVPYTKAPEWVIPGKATYYASAMPRAHGATPLVVTTFEGRPTKLAPNTLHPEGDGTDAFAQASILDLYSPSRSRGFLKNGKSATRSEFETALAELAKNRGVKIGFVFGEDDCPTRNRLIPELKSKFSQARFYRYEALTAESKPLGPNARFVADFAKADRIVALDCDFLELDPMGATAPFFARRKPEGKDYENGHPKDASAMNRFYAVEAAFSLTGGIADHRLRVAPSEVLLIAAGIAQGLGVAGGSAVNDERHASWIAPLVADLKQHAGRSVVLAGSRTSPALQQLAFAINQALGNIGPDKPLQVFNMERPEAGTISQLKRDIDSRAVDTLVLLGPANPVFDAPADLDFAASLANLKLSIHLGERTDATAHACTWHVPAAHYLESWADSRTASGVYTIVQPMILPLYPDCVSETEFLLALLSPEGKLINGEGEKGAPSPAYDAVRKTFAGLGGEGETAWKTLLRDGFFAAAKYAAGNAVPAAGVDVAQSIAEAKTAAPTKDSLQVIFATDASIYDGRWIDNAWLQEAPDPVSKLTWDNAALIAPKTAKALGIYDEEQTTEPVTKAMGVLPVEGKFSAISPDGEGENRKQRMIEIKVNGNTLEIPVIIGFGLAENTVIVPLGYGQAYDKDNELGYKETNVSHVGLVGVNRGFNAYPLRTSATAYVATGAQVRKIDQVYSLALVQEHHSMYGRALAREISTMADEKKGSFRQQLANVAKQGNDSHAPPNISLYKPQTSSQWHPGEDGKAKPLLNDPLHQWGMTIDLTSCLGCNACLIACQAENNIPVVGKEQVARGREMHWVRMDRYYAAQSDNTFDPDNPAVIPQPVSCQQCESAPCETVCPVNATVHTEDGLNAMAYNRCIGTRYCANNCPYKARRFNFFDYNKRNPLIKHNLYKGPLGETTIGDPDHLQKNPNVTVRMRGVMEKCTYCVQRIKDAIIRQKARQKQEVLEAGRISPEVQVTTKTLRVSEHGLNVACQEACSAGAITFGNLLDEKSKLVRAKNLERNYDLLNYIGTRPRTSYLARVKNPNPQMPDAPFIGKSTIHMA